MIPRSIRRVPLIPVLVGCVLVSGTAAFLGLVPMRTCEEPRQARESRDPHEILVEREGKYYSWTCRTCGGDYEATIVQSWFSGEDGVPPPHAEELSRLRFRVKRFMRGEDSK